MLNRRALRRAVVAATKAARFEGAGTTWTGCPAAYAAARALRREGAQASRYAAAVLWAVTAALRGDGQGWAVRQLVTAREEWVRDLEHLGTAA